MARRYTARTSLVGALVGAVLAGVLGLCGTAVWRGVDTPRAAAVSVATPRVSYGWPLAPPHPVRHPFVPPETPYGSGHRGVDLGAARGTAVYAAAPGTVVYAGELAGRGVVSIQHADGLRTTYEPVTAAVHRSDRVGRGQLIGWMQGRSSHCAPETCLHWGARRGETGYVNPLGLLSAGRVRLLPWREPPGGPRDGAVGPR